MQLAALDQVPEAEQRRDREKGLDPGRTLAREPTCLEAVHPAPELVADQDDRREKAALHQVTRPFDAAATPAKGRRREHVGRVLGVETHEGACFGERGAQDAGWKGGLHGSGSGRRESPAQLLSLRRPPEA
jgi:hypothetical protein